MVTLKTSTSLQKNTKKPQSSNKANQGISANKEDAHSPSSGAPAACRKASSNPPSSSPLGNNLKMTQKHEIHEQTSNKTKQTEVR
jgi:hypothetical protein